ncbi:methyltransferase domain-containing protein [Gluconobacter morbifer]|uniref:Biotin synthesis protein BioC n=1 Tax=Gluconobacter morbifer G707 TaxID=1088869 RepID=G6XJC6_9PROT|nr:methyltransferase domain-containing protein [Gluconobacter morbifer]EHH68242.1 biotin synthesis protein BioC [Gluconobacter morbifer G707]
MITPETRQQQIATRFSAATGYDAAAAIQRRCADVLAARIEAYCPQPGQVLEFGCGTGFLTERLATLFPASAILATDLAPGMIERARGRVPDVSFRVMDAENPDISGPFGLIASSLCLQWFTDYRAGLERLCNLLSPGGVLMVTTLLEGSLGEWKAACRAEQAPCGIPDYPSETQMQAEWPVTGKGRWEVLSLTDPVRNARHFLRGLREIGASLPAEGSSPASASALRRAMRRFDSQASDVTYRVGLGVYERTGS